MENESELDVLKKLFHNSYTEAELLDIFYQNRGRCRVLLSLLQQPRFPEKHSLNIIPTLNPMDLIKVVKNKHTPPGIRKRAELELVNKFHKFPLGEKLSYVKIAPTSILEHFLNEQDPRLLSVILGNPYCTQELVLKLLDRKTDKLRLYEALANTEWFMQPDVALSISLDPTAPIRIILAIIPFLNLKHLERLYQNKNTHQIIKQNIVQYLQKRNTPPHGD